MLQEISLTIDQISVISLDMHLLQDLLSTVIQTNILLYTDPITFGSMNIILVSPYKIIILQFLYLFNRILKVLLIIHTHSTWFHVNLILHLLY